MRADLRIALRSNARRPVFATAVILTLSLGIGANGLVANIAAAQRTAPYDDHLRNVAVQVTALDARRQWPSATVATVDSLLAFYSDSVVYEHPSVGAVVRGKAALRSGMQRFLGSRPPSATPTPRITIGPRVAIVELPAGPDPRDRPTPIPPTRRAIRVLEFDDAGLVRRILDYPW